MIKFGEIKINDISKRHIQDCLDNNAITMGSKVKLFEERWRNLFNYKHARLMASGTAAGTASCMALYGFGAKPGQEIICPALSFIATANAIKMSNFLPKFIEIDKRTLNMDETKIEDAITNKTIAIKVVNTMGRPCKLDVIQEIAKRHKLYVIIDACESYGCKYKGKFALEYADMETSSHYAAHCIISGEGGCVSTNSPEIDVMLESVRSHGRRGGSVYFDHQDFGGNFKNTDLHASIGLGELDFFWENFYLRHRNMMRLHHGLKEYKDYFWCSEQDVDCINCPHGFSITLKDPKYDIEKFKLHLQKAEIEFKRNFGCIPTQHGAFKDYGGSFPEAEYVGTHGVHCGVHKYLTDKDLDYMIGVIRDYFD